MKMAEAVSKSERKTDSRKNAPGDSEDGQVALGNEIQGYWTLSGSKSRARGMVWGLQRTELEAVQLLCLYPK